MNSNNNSDNGPVFNKLPDYPVDEKGLPLTSIVPRHGQVIVTPFDAQEEAARSKIIRPDGYMGELLYSRTMVVIAAGPGKISAFSAERAPMDVARGDIILLAASENMNTIRVSDPASPLVLEAVDEMQIMAVIDRVAAAAMVKQMKDREKKSKLKLAGE